MLTEAVLKIASGKRRELVSCLAGGQWKGRKESTAHHCWKEASRKASG